MEHLNYDIDSLLDSYDGEERAVANFGRTFRSFDTNVSITSDFNRSDYEYFRPSDRIPTDPREIISSCMNAYNEVGLVHNIIDLMSEFACDGIHITHPVPSLQRFYRKWFSHINGYAVSERFLNYLYRTANVFCSRKVYQLNKSKFSEWKKAFAIEDLEYSKLKKREIPISYNFLNPSNITIMNKKNGKPIYGLELGYETRNGLMKNGYSQLSPEIQSAIKRGTAVPLDENIIKYFYKKDDWSDFAKPMIYPIMSNIVVLKKMHLADLSALDGAISNIRLWKLGIYNDKNPAASIMPTPRAINKLRNVLSNRGSGGTLDLVWGFELDFKESNTNVHQFLGKEKYEQVMMELYAGLGIPLSLIGMIGASASGTSSFMSLQTLVKRLEYGRNLLRDFWQHELRLIQKSMGFSKCADVKFSTHLLNDEGIRNELLLGLADRNIISNESLLSELNIDSELELNRIKKEEKERKNDRMAKKAGPYHNPQTDEILKEIILKNGGVAPSEMGIELEERKIGEKTLSESVGVPSLEKPSGKNGRPRNSRDGSKRKQKTIASEFVNIFMWSKQAQEDISNIMVDFFKNHYNKKNIRSLSSEQKIESENFKFNILCSMKPFQKIDNESVYNVLSNKVYANKEIISTCKILTKQFMNENNRSPSFEEVKQIQSSAYSVYHSGDYNG